MASNNTQKPYENGRFEFILYVNDDIIAKRNLTIQNYIEHSIETVDFKDCMDNIATMIDNDLKSKSRIYTWYYFNPNEEPAEEFTAPLIEPWSCTFKIVVTDYKRPVFEKIWDGYAYPKSVRDKIDLTNKNVRMYDKSSGEVISIPKEEFFAERGDNLPFFYQVLKAMIMDKGDVIAKITKMISETCSSKEDGYYVNLSDYTTSNVYKTPGKKGVKYNFNMDAVNQKFIAGWSKAVSAKTKAYMETLY